ncbi:MAG: biopolymer transporter ExbD [Planctomycetes bacterium]|nr:biopolymer transporter ExbD [Planctomycetota bacterium]MBL7042561.1 biopolymer transporter ExbD [Pirellulaceae bacterium]
MRTRRATKLLTEPPSSATGDIAFNLIVFFLVCASIQPDSGRRQTLPRSETKSEKTPQDEQLRVLLRRDVALINDSVTLENKFVPKVKALLAGKVRPEDKVVVVKSEKDVPYHHWIKYTTMIEEAGGVITVLREEEQEVRVP